MMRSFLLLIPAMSAAVASLSAQPYDRQEEITEEILIYLETGKAERIVPYFDERTARYLQPSQLKLLWKGIVNENGEYLGSKNGEVLEKGDQIVVSRVCRFTRKRLLFNVTFDEFGKVAGIFFKDRE